MVVLLILLKNLGLYKFQMIVKDKLPSGKIHISGDTFQEKFNNLEGQV